MDLLSECVDIADEFGCRLTIRRSDAHGLCYSVGMVGKDSGTALHQDTIWGDTIEEALQKFKQTRGFKA